MKGTKQRQQQEQQRRRRVSSPSSVVDHPAPSCWAWGDVWTWLQCGEKDDVSDRVVLIPHNDSMGNPIDSKQVFDEYTYDRYGKGEGQVDEGFHYLSNQSYDYDDVAINRYESADEITMDDRSIPAERLQLKILPSSSMSVATYNTQTTQNTNHNYYHNSHSSSASTGLPRTPPHRYSYSTTAFLHPSPYSVTEEDIKEESYEDYADDDDDIVFRQDYPSRVSSSSSSLSRQQAQQYPHYLYPQEALQEQQKQQSDDRYTLDAMKYSAVAKNNTNAPSSMFWCGSCVDEHDHGHYDEQSQQAVDNDMWSLGEQPRLSTVRTDNTTLVARNTGLPTSSSSYRMTIKLSPDKDRFRKYTYGSSMTASSSSLSSSSLSPSSSPMSKTGLSRQPDPSSPSYDMRRTMSESLSELPQTTTTTLPPSATKAAASVPRLPDSRLHLQTLSPKAE